MLKEACTASATASAANAISDVFSKTGIPVRLCRGLPKDATQHEVDEFALRMSAAQQMIHQLKPQFETPDCIKPPTSHHGHYLWERLKLILVHNLSLKECSGMFDFTRFTEGQRTVAAAYFQRNELSMHETAACTQSIIYKAWTLYIFCRTEKFKVAFGLSQKERKHLGQAIEDATLGEIVYEGHASPKHAEPLRFPLLPSRDDVEDHRAIQDEFLCVHARPQMMALAVIQNRLRDQNRYQTLCDFLSDLTLCMMQHVQFHCSNFPHAQLHSAFNMCDTFDAWIDLLRQYPAISGRTP